MDPVRKGMDRLPFTGESGEDGEGVLVFECDVRIEESK